MKKKLVVAEVWGQGGGGREGCVVIKEQHKGFLW